MASLLVIGWRVRQRSHRRRSTVPTVMYYSLPFSLSPLARRHWIRWYRIVHYTPFTRWSKLQANDEQTSSKHRANIKQRWSKHQANMKQLEHTSCTRILNAFAWCLLDVCFIV